MTLMQTLFDRDGKPLGKALTDSQTGRTTFEPRDGNEQFARRTWRSLHGCRRAVLAAAARSKRTTDGRKTGAAV
jgi:hypothetical protein